MICEFICLWIEHVFRLRSFFFIHTYILVFLLKTVKGRKIKKKKHFHQHLTNNKVLILQFGAIKNLIYEIVGCCCLFMYHTFVIFHIWREKQKKMNKLLQFQQCERNTSSGNKKKVNCKFTWCLLRKKKLISNVESKKHANSAILFQPITSFFLISALVDPNNFQTDDNIFLLNVCPWEK